MRFEYEKFLCISIDLDDMRFYRRIHDLGEQCDTPLVFETALPRFVDFCSDMAVKATVFVVSEDLKWKEATESLRKCIELGHEIGSHSVTHMYDLSKQPKEIMRTEVLGSKLALEDTLGVEVHGFRAPGYNLSNELLQEIQEAGYEYDATILPSFSYYLARALIIGLMRLRGKRSASITGRFSDFVRGCKPFKWDNGLVELPITSFFLPLIGTTLSRRTFFRVSKTFLQRQWFVHLVFHALDFLEASEAGTDLLIEPALRVGLRERLESFSITIKSLLDDRKVLTLGEAARMVLK